MCDRRPSHEEEEEEEEQDGDGVKVHRHFLTVTASSPSTDWNRKLIDQQAVGATWSIHCG